jgi:hypothetical protein
MLPASYQVPAAILLLIGGTISCFFGYRLFRIVLAISGFIVGALAASSLFGMSDTGPMLIAAVGRWPAGRGDPLCRLLRRRGARWSRHRGGDRERRLLCG